MIALDILSWVLLGAGAFFLLSGAVGMLRFPDLYSRTHAAGITDSAGAGLILLGLLPHVPGWEVAGRLLIIVLFLVLTAPTATHILAHAARRDGVPVWRTGQDPDE
jgi:multicomponent Na+:H+ antiporter subunit G